MRKLTKEEIEILQRHVKWLKSEEGGEKADLCEADLCEADLYEADLCGADLRGADLREADLREADLSGADLCEADLRGADLRGADLRGTYGNVLSFGPIGSRRGITYVTKCGETIYVRCGCFYGTLEKFASQVSVTHGGSRHEAAYKAAIDFIKTIDTLYWTDVQKDQA